MMYHGNSREQSSILKRRDQKHYNWNDNYIIEHVSVPIHLLICVLILMEHLTPVPHATLMLTFRRLTSTIVTYRTANLQNCILYIYSTNIGTEYFKHGVYSPFFLSLICSLFHNSNLFGSCIIHILYTECANIKKIIPAPKG